MSRFNGCSFIYDNIPSENFNLRIVEFDNAGKQNYDSGVESELSLDVLYRRSKVNYYGRSVNKPLEIDFTAVSFDPISVDDQHIIKSWLLGSMKHVPLRIVQDDMSQIYYNCIITKAEDIKVGNMGYGLSIHFVCDAPWAWENEKILNKDYISGGVTNETFSFFNSSVSKDYLFPIITSSTGFYRLNKFNLNWFRLLQFNNSINILGAISNFKMTYQFAKGG